MMFDSCVFVSLPSPFVTIAPALAAGRRKAIGPGPSSPPTRSARGGGALQFYDPDRIERKVAHRDGLVLPFSSVASSCPSPPSEGRHRRISTTRSAKDGDLSRNRAPGRPSESSSRGDRAERKNIDLQKRGGGPIPFAGTIPSPRNLTSGRPSERRFAKEENILHHPRKEKRDRLAPPPASGGSLPDERKRRGLGRAPLVERNSSFPDNGNSTTHAIVHPHCTHH